MLLMPLSQFVCPVPSTSTSTSSFECPSQSSNPRSPHLPKQCSIKNHRRLVLSNVRSTHAWSPLRTIYVGNVSTILAILFLLECEPILQLVPGICSESLAKVFGQSGLIAEIKVRCSGGLFVSRTDVPDTFITGKDGFYATVRFKDPKSARVALGLHGSSLEGISLPNKRLVVRTSECMITMNSSLCNRSHFLRAICLKPEKMTQVVVCRKPADLGP